MHRLECSRGVLEHWSTFLTCDRNKHRKGCRENGGVCQNQKASAATYTTFFRVMSVSCLLWPPLWNVLVRTSFVSCVCTPRRRPKPFLMPSTFVDAEDRREGDAAGGRRDREFPVQRSRFLAALKTRLGLIMAKTTAMRVVINATGSPAPVSDRTRMKSHSRISQLIASAIEHDLPIPAKRGGRCSNNYIVTRISISSVPLGLPLWCWASLCAFYRS